MRPSGEFEVPGEQPMMPVMTGWIISGLVAFGLGWLLRERDRKSPSRGEIDNRKLTPLQVLYSGLLAYPFCLLFVLLHRSLS
jgi:hypothetical protein